MTIEDGSEQEIKPISNVEDGNNVDFTDTIGNIRGILGRAHAVSSEIESAFQRALDNFEVHAARIPETQIRQAPNLDTVVIVGALMFLAQEGGREAIVRAKDAFAKYFPDVDYRVWLKLQKAAKKKD